MKIIIIYIENFQTFTLMISLPIHNFHIIITMVIIIIITMTSIIIINILYNYYKMLLESCFQHFVKNIFNNNFAKTITILS